MVSFITANPTITDLNFTETTLGSAGRALAMNSYVTETEVALKPFAACSRDGVHNTWDVFVGCYDLNACRIQSSTNIVQLATYIKLCCTVSMLLNSQLTCRLLRCLDCSPHKASPRGSMQGWTSEVHS